MYARLILTFVIGFTHFLSDITVKEATDASHGMHSSVEYMLYRVIIHAFDTAVRQRSLNYSNRAR